MNCATAKSLLSPHIDGQVAESESRDLREHLDACPPCKKELSALNSLCRLLKGLPQNPLPAGFLQRLRSRQRNTEAEVARFSLWPRLGAFAAASLAIVFLLRNFDAPLRQFVTASSPPLSPPTLDQDVAQAPQRARGPSAAVSNETLHKALVQEADKMGIQAINPGRESEHFQPLMGERLGEPGTREQAEESIQRFAQLRRSVDESRGRPKSVLIAGKTAPVLAAAGAPTGGAPLAVQGEWHGSYSAGEQQTLTIGDEKTWAKIWAMTSKEALPNVDFKHNEIVAIFLGTRPTGGYGVEITGIASNESEVEVRYREIKPAGNSMVTEALTAPYIMRVIARSDLPVRFKPTTLSEDR